MADVPGKFFSATKVRTGVAPSSSGSLVGEPLPPVNPPGSSLNSVGLTMPSAFTVSNSPLTANGTIGVAGAGTVGQYIRGDGSLADFPESSGGGSSVSYYLNGSISQGTIGGVAYKEMNKVPILGAGTDFTINADGYIASFITDAGDPNLLEIPGGNWNFETYFSASSSGGTPTFYVELYKYDGTTFTLIASSSSSPELIAFGTNLNPYFSTLAVPTTTLALTDRLAIRYYVTHSGRTITLHTENNHLCQVVTTFTTGLTSLNGLTAQVQNLAVGTSGTDFNIASATATHTFNLPTASATNRGALSSADWSLFTQAYNDKINSAAVTGTTTKTLTLTQQDGGTITASWSDLNTDAVTSVFGRTGAVVAANGDYTTAQVTESGNLYYTEARVSANTDVAANTAARHNAVTLGTANGLSLSTQVLSLGLASGSTTGALSSTDWTTFNNKQNALGYVPVPETRTITINGTSQDLSANRTYNVGTVTSVAALTLGTSGTDLSSTVANGTTTPVITLNVPTASATNRGALSAADWTTFNNKENAITAGTTAQYYRGDKTFQTLNTSVVPELTNLYYTEARVNANANVAANTAARHNAVTLGTANGLSLSTQQLSLGLASSSANGALSSTDWTTFNNKQNALTNPVTGTGTTNYLPKFTGTSTIGNSQIFDNGTNVGIGISNPNIYDSNADNLVIGSTGANDKNGITIVGGDTDGRGAIYFADTTQNSAGFITYLHSNNRLLFGTSDTTRVTIDSSGNLGLGVTPSAWSSSWRAFEFQAAAISWTGAGANDFSFSTNSFFDATDSRWEYKGTGDGAARYSITALTSEHRWFNAPIGTAGNAISFTQAMTLFSDGNLLLTNGTVTNAGFKLDVNGTGRFSGALTGASASFGDTVTNTSGGYRTSVQQGYILRNDANSVNLGGLTRRSFWAGGTALDTQIFAETGYSIFLNPGGSSSIGLTLASTGAATFSSSVTATAFIPSGSTVPTNGMYLPATNTVAFSTNTVERMRIHQTTNGGYFKASNDGVYQNAGSTGSYHEINQSLNNTDSLVVSSNGNSSPYGMSVWFPNADPNNATNWSYAAFTGTNPFITIYKIFSNGTVAARSDARWKKNIETTRNGYIDDLCKLRVVKYNWYNHEDDAPKELGLIAQEVEEVFPNLINIEPVIAKKEVEQEDGTIIEQQFEDGVSRSIKTSVLPYMLLKAIQEQQLQIQELKNKLL